MLRGVALVVCAACAWGTWSLFLRPTGLPAAWTAAIVASLVALLTIPLFGRDPAPRWDRRTLVLLGVFAVLDAVNVGTFFAAMSATSVAIAVLTHSFAPILVALAAPFVERQRVPGAPVAAAVALGGIVLLVRPWEGVRGDVLVGAALGSASAFAYAGNVFLTRHLTPRLGAARTMGLHSAGSALLLIPFAIATPAEVELGDLGLLALGAALLGVGGNVAFANGIVRIGSARAAVLAFLEPLVACVVGWAAFGEELGPLSALGGALILGAGVLVARAEPEPVAAVASEPAVTG